MYSKVPLTTSIKNKPGGLSYLGFFNEAFLDAGTSQNVEWPHLIVHLNSICMIDSDMNFCLDIIIVLEAFVLPLALIVQYWQAYSSHMSFLPNATTGLGVIPSNMKSIFLLFSLLPKHVVIRIAWRIQVYKNQSDGFANCRGGVAM